MKKDIVRGKHVHGYMLRNSLNPSMPDFLSPFTNRTSIRGELGATAQGRIRRGLKYVLFFSLLFVK